jgi:hypothetical protein
MFTESLRSSTWWNADQVWWRLICLGKGKKRNLRLKFEIEILGTVEGSTAKIVSCDLDIVSVVDPRLHLLVHNRYLSLL